MSFHQRVSAAILAGLVVVAASGAAQDPESLAAEYQNVYIGGENPSAEILEPRAESQRQSAAAVLEVFHDFRFQDRYQDSGITFLHRPTDDGLAEYAMVHYDHGNGLAVADVDGDDRYDIYFVSQFGGNELWRNLGGGKFEDITERRRRGDGRSDLRRRRLRRTSTTTATPTSSRALGADRQRALREPR